MKARAWLCVAVAAGLVVASGAAWAGHDEPFKANKVQATVVTAYAVCAAVNDTTTGALAFPACHPSVRNDPGCGFDVKGQGQVQAIVVGKGATQDVKVQAKLNKLEPGCEGETICVYATLRATTDACASGDPLGCTVIDLADFPIGTACGTVSGGKLNIKTTVDTALGADVIADSNLGLQIRGIGLRRTSSVNSPAPAANSFEMGLVAP